MPQRSRTSLWLLLTTSLLVLTALGWSFAEPALHDDVLSFHVSALAQALPERLDVLRNSSRSGCMENADPGDLRRRLRAGGEGRNERAEGQRDDKRDRPRDYFGDCRTNSTGTTSQWSRCFGCFCRIRTIGVW